MKFVKPYIYTFFKYAFIVFVFTHRFIVSASTTDGTIDSTYYSALLCTNIPMSPSSSNKIRHGRNINSLWETKYETTCSG